MAICLPSGDYLASIKDPGSPNVREVISESRAVLLGFDQSRGGRLAGFLGKDGSSGTRALFSLAATRPNSSKSPFPYCQVMAGLKMRSSFLLSGDQSLTSK